MMSTTLTMPPGWSPRGLAVLGRPDPPAARPAPTASGPAEQSRWPDETDLGASLWVYLLGLVCSTVALLLMAFAIGRGRDLWAPVVCAATVWGLSLAGVIDYARRRLP